jgi:hypothetical protein
VDSFELHRASRAIGVSGGARVSRLADAAYRRRRDPTPGAVPLALVRLLGGGARPLRWRSRYRASVTLADTSATAMEFVIGFAVFAPFPILAVLCWVFWRAKKREDAEREAGITRPG